MKYLDIDKLRGLTTEAFWQQDPYPWISQQGLITETGYQELLDTLPALSQFEEKFAYERRAGQKPHDRYSLEYTSGYGGVAGLEGVYRRALQR